MMFLAAHPLQACLISEIADDFTRLCFGCLIDGFWMIIGLLEKPFYPLSDLIATFSSDLSEYDRAMMFFFRLSIPPAQEFFQNELDFVDRCSVLQTLVESIAGWEQVTDSVSSREK